MIAGSISFGFSQRPMNGLEYFESIIKVLLPTDLLELSRLDIDLVC